VSPKFLSLRIESTIIDLYFTRAIMIVIEYNKHFIIICKNCQSILSRYINKTINYYILLPSKDGEHAL